MSGLPSVRASVLLPLVQQIDTTWGKGDILLALHGILRAQLEDPYARVSMSRYVALFEDAATLIKEPHLGAMLGLATKPGDLGPAGLLFSMSSTIRRAFERVTSNVQSLQGATSSGLIEDSDELIWSYRITDESIWPRRQDSEFTISTTLQMVRSFFDPNWSPLEIHFEHGEPSGVKELEKLFQAPLIFGQSSNRIIFDREGADKRYRVEDPALTTIIERHLSDIIGEVDGNLSFTSKVSSYIEIHLTHKRITLPEIARELKISPRTLQRRLAEEGTSLRVLIESHRNSVTTNLLQAKIRKNRIAETLGYADSTTFWRARRNWSSDT
nr:AraC family transcriptional regulator ligand-binding domain-containing protein [uncultured Cohaesibacter sp.]